MNKNFFDPTGLERAAAALRELNQSPNARQALEVMVKTEETKKAEKQVQLKQLEISKAKTEGEERRRNLELQKENNKEIAQFNDKLERQRNKDKLQEQEESAQRMREEQEDSIKRQEALRRETMNHQMQKQYELEEKKIILQNKLQTESYRKNHDLIQKEQESKNRLEQESKKSIHLLYIEKAAESFKYLQNNKSALTTIELTALSLSAGFYLSKQGLSLIFRQIEALIRQPSLVRETSRRSLKWILPSKKNIFNNLVLNDNLSLQLNTITAGLIAKQNNNAPLRNFLLYGPPGTGKTMFAKLLAYNSGLHYAIISGGDIEKLGSQAVPQIDKLFSWCHSTPKGTLIFIDEAEAIFYKRNRSAQTSSALSNFLAQTSAASNHFSLILATNLPEQLDAAILDRMDQIIHFEYLNINQRLQLLKKGFSQLTLQRGVLSRLLKPLSLFKRQISLNMILTDEELHKLASLLDNFSPRQIDKFILSVHDQALGECVLNSKYICDIDFAFVEKVLNQTIEQNNIRIQWSNN